MLSFSYGAFAEQIPVNAEKWDMVQDEDDDMPEGDDEMPEGDDDEPVIKPKPKPKPKPKQPRASEAQAEASQNESQSQNRKKKYQTNRLHFGTPRLRQRKSQCKKIGLGLMNDLVCGTTFLNLPKTIKKRPAPSKGSGMWEEATSEENEESYTTPNRTRRRPSLFDDDSGDDGGATLPTETRVIDPDIEIPEEIAPATMIKLGCGQRLVSLAVRRSLAAQVTVFIFS